jgi:(p)ppGpp synthase/HD superfamily hydrolase
LDDLILRAARLAREAHTGQLRKYHRRPYIEHPARVASRVMLLEDATAELVAAAWLHDVVEDCGYTISHLAKAGMPHATIHYVLELTNPSTQHPGLPRHERKRLDREHLKSISLLARKVKLIDRIDNLRDVAAADHDFRSLYAAESLLLAEALHGVDAALVEELYRAIEELGFSRTHQHPEAAR